MSAVEEFVEASENGDEQKMSALLPKVDVNAADSEGWTALQKAAYAGQSAAAQWLVKSAGADVDRERAASDEVTAGATPLYLACREGKKDVAQFLIGAGADLNKAKKGGFTPLHAACPDHPDIAELLIDAGVDVNKANNAGATPCDFGRGNATLAKLLLAAGAVGTINGFTLAARRGDVETMKQFEGFDVNQADSDNWTALQLALVESHLEAVQWLVDVAGADIERAQEEGTTPLILACQSTGKNEVVQFLIGKGADVNKARNHGVVPLHIAAEYGRDAVVKSLIAAGADLNKATNDGWTALVLKGHDAVVESLIAAGADLNKARDDGATPLFAGAYLGSVAADESLIAAGADLNMAHNSSATPLLIGVKKGHEAVVKSLIAAGADLNKSSDCGETPHFVGAFFGREAVVKSLIAVGADLNKANNIGAPPLWIGAEKGDDAVVKLLIAAGADLNKTKPLPSHVGAFFGREAVVNALIAAGADPQNSMDNGLTPVQCAEYRRHETVAELLRDAERRASAAAAFYRAALLVHTMSRRTLLRRLAEALCDDSTLYWLTEAERARLFSLSRSAPLRRAARAPLLASLTNYTARVLSRCVRWPAMMGDVLSDAQRNRRQEEVEEEEDDDEEQDEEDDGWAAVARRCHLCIIDHDRGAALHARA